MSDISKIKLPNGDIYNLKDNLALHQGDATLGAITGIVKLNSNLLTITDGASNYPIEELKITFGPHQEGSGDPTPTNVRPITGYTGILVYNADKAPTNGIYSFTPIKSGSGISSPTNIRTILPGLTLVRDDETTLIIYGGTLNIATKELKATYIAKKIQLLGVGYNSDGYFYSTISGKANGVYNVISEIYQNTDTGAANMPNYSIKGTASNNNVFFMDKRYSQTSTWLAGIGDTYIAYEVATPTTYILSDTEIERTLIALGINENTYKVEFPTDIGTVYGGTLDVVNGVLTVDYKAIILNANTPCEEFRTQNNGLYTVWSGITDMASGIFATDNKVMLDRVIKVANRADVSVTTLAALVGNNNKSIYLYNLDSVFGYTTTEQISNWLAQNPITCTIKLATPLTYQLTPQQINTLLGENNFWTNINSTISIKYAADTKLFILLNTVKDVQIDNTSLVNDGIASIPYASTETPGVGKINSNAGITLYNGFFSIYGATDNRIKSGNDLAAAVVAANQHTSTFYGLAKAAGVDERTSSNTLGTYTDAAKGAIQHMIGTDTAIAPYEADITADRSYAIDDTFMLNGKLYKATAAIALGGVITPNTNCIEIKLEDIYVKNTDYANSNTGGVVKIGGAAYGLTIENGQLGIAEATTSYIKQGNGYYRPLTSAYVPTITFYGLAKAAGDTTQIQSDNAVGTYTDEAKVAIQTMLNVPDTSEVVNDVQINSTSIINNGVANIPLASTTTVGAVKLGDTMSITGSGAINFRAVGASEVKAGTTYQRALSPERQHASVFYGLTKAAGVDMKNSDNAIGVYTNEAKTAICSMIGASDIVKVQDTLPTTPTTLLWIQDSAQAAVQVPTVSEMQQAIEDASIDVQINGTSITSNGVANIPLASTTDFGIIRLGMLNNSIPSGIAIDTSGKLFIRQAYSNEIPAGSLLHPPITPSTQHISTFYGLAKAAGDTTQAASSNAVGTYTSEAKIAIQQMIGLGTINASTVAATLDSTSKTYLLGTQSTITSTAANVSVSGDTGVYLTTNQGLISAAQHSINVNGTEKAYMTYNTTDLSIDFIFI